ncbi:hypothetical protein BURPS1106B_A3500 [Burkholderia pseudomallei 1106b]|nr:hypothetical protein BPC006_I0204 [Burkholderia pseudomallei BPC006]EES27736.1 hypothetical protein BURPS1106B_A3500 [Burkholderia pseudomallei 1106b]
MATTAKSERRARAATRGRVVHCIAAPESHRKEEMKAFRRIVHAKPRNLRVFVVLRSFG